MTGEKRARTEKICRDTALYFAWSPGRKMASGQRRRAVTMGIAECTPNFRAS